MFPVQCFSDKNKTRQTFSFQRHKHTTSPWLGDKLFPQRARPPLFKHLRLQRLHCEFYSSISYPGSKKKGEIWAIKQEYCKEASLCRSGCDADLTWRVCVFSVRIPVTAAKWLRPHLILDTTPEGLNSDRPNSVGGIISGVEDSDSLGPFPRMP